MSSGFSIFHCSKLHPPARRTDTQKKIGKATIQVYVILSSSCFNSLECASFCVMTIINNDIFLKKNYWSRLSPQPQTCLHPFRYVSINCMYRHRLLMLSLINTFSVLSLLLKKPHRHNESATALDLSYANPACDHKEARSSTGYIMVTTRYSNQQGHIGLTTREYRAYPKVFTV